MKTEHVNFRVDQKKSREVVKLALASDNVNINKVLFKQANFRQVDKTRIGYFTKNIPIIFV